MRRLSAAPQSEQRRAIRPCVSPTVGAISATVFILLPHRLHAGGSGICTPLAALLQGKYRELDIVPLRENQSQMATEVTDKTPKL
jgi:hypothetical protein